MITNIFVEVEGERYLMGTQWRGDYFAGGSSVNYFSRRYWNMPSSRHIAHYDDGHEEIISYEDAISIIASWG